MALPRSWKWRTCDCPNHVFLASYGWFVAGLVGAIPNRAELRAFRAMPSANILFDSADREVFTIAKEHRIEVPLTEVSKVLIDAVIAIEDRRFFDHEGVDPIRIVGSALAGLRAGEAVQGGSTITQQLARQSVGREKTLSRKVKEMLFAAQLEHHLSKNEILELYLNKVYFGDGLYGVEAASRGYFGKKASELSLPEAALLAGLLKAPSTYAPTVSPEKAEARQGVVLRAMLDHKAITRDQYDRASDRHRRDLRRPARRGTLRPLLQGRSAAPARRALRRRASGARRAEGLHDDRSRHAASGRSGGRAGPRATYRKDAAEAPHAASGEPLQAALVAIDPTNGHVLAMVGGRDFVQELLQSRHAGEAAAWLGVQAVHLCGGG